MYFEKRAAYHLDGLLEPLLVFERDEAIGDDTTTLVLPQRHQNLGRDYDVRGSDEHSLPDSTEIAQVKYVVELCRRRGHLVLDLLPEDARRRNEHLDDLAHVLGETTLLETCK